MIYNNEAGNFSGTLGNAGSWIPVVSLSREDGLLVKARGVHSVTLVNRPGNYGIMDGTSMAAPHVSGALGLLAAQFPADDLPKRISRLYSGADRLAALESKMKTGARLNLARALAQNLVLAMTVSRQQASVWVVNKDFAEVYFSVEKDPGSTISGETYTVYRKDARRQLPADQGDRRPANSRTAPILFSTNTLTGPWHIPTWSRPGTPRAKSSPCPTNRAFEVPQ